MAQKPGDSSKWATDANYTNGPPGVPGTPTKVAPSTPEVQEGFIPADEPSPQKHNWWRNLVYKFVLYLDDLFLGKSFPGRMRGFIVTEGSSPGLFSVYRESGESYAYFMSPDGFRIEMSADDVDFNSGSAATAFNPGTEATRLDGITVDYTEATEVLDFTYWEDIEGTPPTDPDLLICKIVVEDNATFTVGQLIYMVKRNFKRSRILVGDGTLADNVDVVGHADLQDEIDYLNSKGGGTLDITGFMYNVREATEFKMKSGVIVRGNGMGRIRGKTGDAFIFSMAGAPLVSGTVTVAGKLTVASGDFYDYGIGSRIGFTSGSNSGTVAYIWKIDDALNCWLVNEYKQPDTFVAETGTAGFDVLLADAGIELMELDGTSMASSTNMIEITDTYKCFAKFTKAVDDSGDPTHRAIDWSNRNEAFSLIGCNIVDTAGIINSGSASINPDWLVIGNDFGAACVGLFGGICAGNSGAGGWVTSDAGWQSEPETEEHNTDGTHKGDVARFLTGFTCTSTASGASTTLPCHRVGGATITYLSSTAFSTGNGTYPNWYVRVDVGSGWYQIRPPHVISGGVVTLDYNYTDLNMHFHHLAGTGYILEDLFDGTNKFFQLMIYSGGPIAGTWSVIVFAVA